MYVLYTTHVIISAWSGLPEPENPLGLEQFFKPE